MKKILIIDDERDLVELMKEHLLNLGFQVMIASDGVVGLTKAKTELPDLIILDLSMPHMDGIKFIQYIKEIDPAKEIPVLVSSGLINIEELQAQGIKHWLQKPYSSKELVSKIESIFDQSQQS